MLPLLILQYAAEGFSLSVSSTVKSCMPAYISAMFSLQSTSLALCHRFYHKESRDDDNYDVPKRLNIGIKDRLKDIERKTSTSYTFQFNLTICETERQVSMDSVLLSIPIVNGIDEKSSEHIISQSLPTVDH